MRLKSVIAEPVARRAPTLFVCTRILNGVEVRQGHEQIKCEEMLRA